MKKYLIRALLTISILFLFAHTVRAGVPTDHVKAATDKLYEIITSQELETPEMAEQRARMIRETVDTVFNWKAFSQRALGKHWKRLSNEQKEEFVFLFGQLVERTYMNKTRQYSGERINFISEETDGKRGILGAEVEIKKGTKIKVEFRVMKEKEIWSIYDVYVEGISIVNNYRVQFSNILIKSDYTELLSMLKTKLDN